MHTICRKDPDQLLYTVWWYAACACACSRVDRLEDSTPSAGFPPRLMVKATVAAANGKHIKVSHHIINSHPTDLISPTTVPCLYRPSVPRTRPAATSSHEKPPLQIAPQHRGFKAVSHEAVLLSTIPRFTTPSQTMLREDSAFPVVWLES